MPIGGMWHRMLTYNTDRAPSELSLADRIRQRFIKGPDVSINDRYHTMELSGAQDLPSHENSEVTRFFNKRVTND